MNVCFDMPRAFRGAENSKLPESVEDVFPKMTEEKAKEIFAKFGHTFEPVGESK